MLLNLNKYTKESLEIKLELNLLNCVRTNEQNMLV